MSYQEAAEHHAQASAVLRHEIKGLLNELNEHQLGTLKIMFEYLMEAGKKGACAYHGMVSQLLETKFGICWACDTKPCKHELGLSELLDQENVVAGMTCPVCGAVQVKVNLPDEVGQTIELKCGHRIEKVANDSEAIMLRMDRCPTCGSSDPRTHPSTAADGEVIALCGDDWHGGYPKRLDVIDMSTLESVAEPPDLNVGESGSLSPNQLAAMEEWNLDDVREEGTNKLLYFVCRGCMIQTHPTIEDRTLFPKGIDGCSGCRERARHG
jgi:hypothetical protein